MGITNLDNTKPSIGYKLLHLLFEPYKWLVFAPALGLSTLVLSILSVVAVTFVGPKRAGKVGMLWGRINAWVGTMRVSVSGREHIDPTQSYVIVSNHQSLFDSLVIYGWLGVDFRWIMKQELRKVPALGYSCEKLEHIYIDRSNAKATVASLNAAKAKIVNGTSVLFFVEGTRSKDGQLLPFKAGAFQMALKMKLPILPITIVGTKNILPAGTTHLWPGKAKLIIHQPIPTIEYNRKQIKELMEITRKQMVSALEQV